MGGGYFGVNFGHLKYEVFRNGAGGLSSLKFQKGLSGEFGQKFTVQPETCLCITDSLSHTTYVETKKDGILLIKQECIPVGCVLAAH